jgi:hypothetical protein
VEESVREAALVDGLSSLELVRELYVEPYSWHSLRAEPAKLAEYVADCT